MKTYDVAGHIEWARTNDKDTFLNCFAGSVATETAKVKVRHQLTTRPHTFQNGDKGRVADKLIIEIDFSTATVQPHNDFEADFCGPVVDAVSNNINGLFENADD